MPLRLHSRQSDFPERFDAFLGDKREGAVDVSQQVAEILAQVKSRGDDAVLDYTRRFDRVDFTVADLRLPGAALDQAMGEVPGDQIRALEHAHERITAYHARQLPVDDRFTDANGIERGTATAAASRSITVREDISLNEREKTWFRIVDRLLADFNSEMEANLRQHLAPWLR